MGTVACSRVLVSWGIIVENKDERNEKWGPPSLPYRCFSCCFLADWRRLRTGADSSLFFGGRTGGKKQKDKKNPVNSDKKSNGKMFALEIEALKHLFNHWNNLKMPVNTVHLYGP